MESELVLFNNFAAVYVNARDMHTYSYTYTHCVYNVF